MLSIVLPCKNEGVALARILPELKAAVPEAEIIVVNDGSTDNTADLCRDLGICTVEHQQSLGNGAAIKSGARAASGDAIVFMDADGQHRPADVARLVATYESGYDMVVGARSYSSQAGVHRAIANSIYNWFASWMVGRRVEDLTSGFRVVNARKFRQFLYLLPNGFSYPTTITMSFFRAGYSVNYVAIEAPPRIGKSHVKLVQDGLRFFLIIFKIGVLYSPLKLFLPISLAFFLTASCYYLYTFLSFGRFTNMSAVLYITSVHVFLMGLISEQISSLNYKESDSGARAP